MAKFKVQSFKEKQTKAGKTFYLASGELDGSLEMVTMWDLPEIGKECKCTTKENDYGITFSTRRQGGGNGYRNDPEAQASIIFARTHLGTP